MAGGMTPADIANQALDRIGWPESIADLEEGTDAAQVCLRFYGECLKQLLRAAHWNFARKQAPLTLLADASGNTANVGTVVPFNWLYEYALPTDSAKFRFIPWNWQNQASDVPSNNIVPPNNGSPLTSVQNAQPPGAPMRVARFQIATDFNYPPLPGQDTWLVQGVSPQGRTVVLTNTKNAQGVYTAIMLYPSVWDSAFRAAMVDFLACEIAVGVWKKKDLKIGLAMRDEMGNQVRAKVLEARIRDGDEGMPNSDIRVDWMDGRRVGGMWSPWGGGGGSGGGWGPGVYGSSWESIALSNGATF